MTTHRKRPASRKGARSGGPRPEPTRPAAQLAPDTAGGDVPAGLGLAIDLNAVPDIEPPRAQPQLAPTEPAPAAEPVLAGFSSSAEPARAPRRGALPARARSRPAARVYALSRAEEYAFIEEDMRRLLAIAGILLVLMLGLLFVLER